MRDLLPPIDYVPLSALLSAPLMLLLFVTIVWWVYRRDRKKGYDETQLLPLDDEQQGGTHRQERN